MDIPSYLMGRNSGGGGKGAKIEVVTELPETGEANVIYLVPKETEDENNVFDEYIWINDDWELIGSTAIDISGKQDVMQFSTMPTADSTTVGKIIQYTGTTGNGYTNGYFYIGTTDGTNYSWSNINVQAGGSNLPIYVLNTTNQLNDSSGAQNLENDAKTRYSEIITDAYAKGYKSIAILLCSTSSGKNYMFYSNSIISTSTFPAFYADCTFKNQNNMDVIVRRSLSGSGTWNNGVFTLSGSLTYDVEKKNLLYSNNSTAYTPTGDYNPATKKYVDDSIATAITTTLGGSF